MTLKKPVGNLGKYPDKPLPESHITKTTPKGEIALNKMPVLREILSNVNELRMARQDFIDKIPTLEENVTLALDATKKFLLDLDDDEVRKIKINTVQDARCLTSIAKEFNDMLRTEMGLHNSIVKHEVELSLEQTKKVFKQLREVDKVFDYPLEEDAEEINT